MKRIDTATKAVDLFGAGKHGYKDGNKLLGIAPTDFNASSFNAIQEEISRVVEAAGIALDGTVYTQLLQALNAGWGMTKSYGASGWQKLPGGLIMQWGIANTGAGGTVAVSFPMTFPNAAHQLVIGLFSMLPVGGVYGWNSLTTSGVNLVCSVASSTAPLAAAISYIAIGY